LLRFLRVIVCFEDPRQTEPLMNAFEVVQVGTIDVAGQKLAMRLFNNEVSLKIADEILSGRTYPHVHFVK